jgi:hypothetical protein
MNKKVFIADNVQQTAINEMASNTPLRVIKLKAESNDKAFNALNSAIKAGATTLIVTPRVDVAGCGYVWFGIRKGQTELDGKLLLNNQIWDFVQAFLLGEELPEVKNFNPDSEACCQEEWLAQVESEIERLRDDPNVRLARKELRIQYKRRQVLYNLRNLEKRGRELAKLGYTCDNIEDIMLGSDIEEDYAE